MCNQNKMLPISLLKGLTCLTVSVVVYEHRHIHHLPILLLLVLKYVYCISVVTKHGVLF